MWNRSPDLSAPQARADGFTSARPRKRNQSCRLAILSVLLAFPSLAETGKPILAQHPALSKTQIAFSYAGDLWTVGREGGAARRLTAGPGIERDSIFSPDGTQIAFTGEYDGNVDVFTIPAAGEEPKRITAHPGIDSAIGWSPDGTHILFRSSRNSYSRYNQLFTIEAAKGPRRGGYTYFNRYFFAQVNKQGAVVDERFNGGGALADWVVDNLRRPLMNLIATRHGKDVTMPQEAIFGPKAMIVNEFAGSGGDAMPYYFKTLNVGPLVGKRTWGGLVGIFFVPGLIDGGNITASNHAIYLPNGQWGIENVGVPPDIDVEPTYKRPAYPNYHGAPGTGGGAK